MLHEFMDGKLMKIKCKKCGKAIEFENFNHIDSVGSLTSPYIQCGNCCKYNYEFEIYVRG